MSERPFSAGVDRRRPGRPRPAGLPGWAGTLLATAAGALQAFAFAPWEFWWLQMLCVAALVALVRDVPPRIVALRAWAFGFGWLLAGFWWIYISLHVYGFLPAWLSVLAVMTLAGLMSLYYGLALWAWGHLRRGGVLVDAASFAAFWMMAELARGTFLTGLPWIVSGYAHTSGPLTPWVPYIGVYGVGALSAWIGAVVALTLSGLRGSRLALPVEASPILLPALVLAAGAALPQGFTRSTGTLSVSLLQTNVAQDDKFEAEHVKSALVWHVRRFDATKAQLVVTPESSLPLPASQIPTDVWRSYQRAFDAPGRAVLVGVFLGDDVHGYVNSLVGLDATHHLVDGTEYHYGKRHLLAFGEFVPPGFQWMLDLMRIPVGNQASGTDTASFAVAGQRVRPLICYEDLFGEDFAPSVVGPDAATVLANATNLAWFGKRMILDQHLQFSRMRALEFQRGQVRATNTGVTAVIDYHGHVTARLPPEVEGQLDASVEGRIGDTPYARCLAQWRLWPLWGLALATILVSRLVARR